MLATQEGFHGTRGRGDRLWILREGTPLELDARRWDAWLDGKEGRVLASESGRSPARILSLAPGQEAVLRVYRHGGLFGALTRDLFFGTGRPRRELEVSEAIRRDGLATPEILALYSRRVFPGLYRSCVLSRRIPESENLRQWLGGEGRELGSWEPMMTEVARTVSLLHLAGCFHRDLNLSNLLTAPSGIWILDLDGARLRTSLTIEERGANLMRLYRSLCKESGMPEPLPPRMRVRFLRHYAGRDRILFRDLSRWLRSRWMPERLRRSVSRKRKLRG